MMRLLVISSICLILLSGCYTTNSIIQPPKIDSYLLEECSSFENVTKFNSFGDVLVQKAKDNKVFAECAAKHRGLSSTIKKYIEEIKKDATK